ncbi:helix-turn-helix transcriptional regulator [Avibacterium paragallinarum]|uniref:helix-turn-helix transcriptional regulator n=1 Tax=Avibacterium paragallinarum TaxID=728 RepID=UPI00021AD096|nr:helix-turn-helix domain-containing protein [Avibacterium paragallinarum]AZI13434.1 DNA-binding protein [Avibacterium paragallinarum]QIR12899.1 helix-turn-helix domain-containing protein [Avibacterium paragallinarum]QJE10858.1 helix-turn-helix domain-containing protein [Avibacterium paragallinarum]QJE13051.1 helix-turn-helix domain-containing protein [Avibacterium paragallinarum]QJE15252.1 helix-turn-helix domain-containing protein [Avibacterium paragallinarum]
MNNQPIEKYYTTKELIERGIGSRSTVDRLVRAGKLKRVKIGTASRYPESSVKAYLASLEA